MPRKRRIVTEYDDDAESTNERMIEPPADPAEDTYQSFMGQFATEGVKVKVYRQTPTGKQYCFWGTPAEVDEESIRLYHAKQSYGHEASTYIVQVEVRGEFRNSFSVSVAPQIATPGSTSGNGDGQTQMMFKMLMDQNARLEQRLLQNSQQDREPISALADAMLKLSQLQQAQSQPMPIDTLMKCIELGRTLNADGGSDWKSTLLEVVKESMPAIQGVMMASRNPPNPQQQRLPEATPAPVTENPSMEQLHAQLKIGLDWLKRKCLSGSDPGLYIDWIIDNRENLPYAQLIHAVVAQPLSAFVQIDSEIGKPPYEAFFTTLYNGIREAFAGQDSVEVDTAKQGRDAADAKSNGKPSSKRSAG